MGVHRLVNGRAAQAGGLQRQAARVRDVHGAVLDQVRAVHKDRAGHSIQRAEGWQQPQEAVCVFQGGGRRSGGNTRAAGISRFIPLGIRTFREPLQKHRHAEVPVSPAVHRVSGQVSGRFAAHRDKGWESVGWRQDLC